MVSQYIVSTHVDHSFAANSNPSSSFVATSCLSTSMTGTFCNISQQACNLLQPCYNSGTCQNNQSLPVGYQCSCQQGFDGSQCQDDNRPCKDSRCWNGGKNNRYINERQIHLIHWKGLCTNVSSIHFNCSCVDGWTGINCETKVDYCVNVTCANGGICRAILEGFECECLGTSYSGRYCEVTSSRLTTIKAVNRSLGCVALAAVITSVALIVGLDLMKYVFGVDFGYAARSKHRRRRPTHRPLAAVRFLYVN
jgi:hypothetical protein